MLLELVVFGPVVALIVRLLVLVEVLLAGAVTFKVLLWLAAPVLL